MRVLYVDLCPSPGGSIFSLLHLVSHLDRCEIQPLVALAAVNPFTRFEEAGIAVVRVHTPRWERRPAGLTSQAALGPGDAKAPRPQSALGLPRADRLQTSKLGETIRHSAWGAGLWHTAGAARRLLRDDAPVALTLRRIIADFRPHLVHLNDVLPLNRPGVLASRSAGLPAICHCRSFAAASPPDNRWLVPAISGMIFISQAIAETHLAATPLLRHYAVIPNAVDLRDFSAPVDRAAVRASLGVPAGAPLLVMAGRISPWKGQHVFVEALARVRQAYPAAHGVIAGLAEEADGPGYAGRVQTLAVSLGLGQHLHMAGFRSDLPQVLAAADAVVHCSVKPEPFGRVIIEGMAAGRPVVASALGGAAEIVADGVDGLLTPAGDAAALAAALCRLLADPDEGARLGAAGRRTVDQRYQVDAHVRAVHTFYERVLADRREV
jgi:glycosyltransferase involved in cell wall biosynthesis